MNSITSGILASAEVEADSLIQTVSRWTGSRHKPSPAYCEIEVAVFIDVKG